MIASEVSHQIVVIGSMNMDLVVKVPEIPKRGETIVGSKLQRIPGGKGGNQAVAAAALGASVTLVAMVGADVFGDELVDSATRFGVNSTHVQKHPTEPTGTALITVSDDGENAIVVATGANSELTPEILEKSLSQIGTYKVMVVSLEVPIKTATHSLKLANQIDAKSIVNLSPLGTDWTELLAYADYLIVNEHEVVEITQCSVAETRNLALSLQKYGAKEVVVTLGPLGAMYLDLRNNDFIIKKIGAPAVTAIDTTGCGDAFTGAFACEIARGSAIEVALDFAVRAGSYAALSMGAQTSYGSREDIGSMKLRSS